MTQINNFLIEPATFLRFYPSEEIDLKTSCPSFLTQSPLMKVRNKRPLNFEAKKGQNNQISNAITGVDAVKH
jgi:hypothetical protein